MSSGTKNTVVVVQPKELINDIDGNIISVAAGEHKNEEITKEKVEMSSEEPKMDENVLAALKAKKAAKETSTPEKSVEEVKKATSIRWACVGSGQFGGRLAESFYKRGYPAVAINTAQQDLTHIEIPESNKMLLNFGLGGAAKDQAIGAAAAEQYKEEIADFISKKSADAQLLIFATSLGGGSGAGSAETILDILGQTDKPVVVITTLPMSTDDPQTKDNSIRTLSRFTQLVNSGKIHNLILVDNARIETLYQDVSPMEFFKVSNEAIVEPLDQFNMLSMLPSPVKALDSTEFAKLFTDSQGITIYGTMKVPNFEEETALAEAVMNLDGSLLAAGFDLKKAKYVGAIFAANKKVWSMIPSASLNYTAAMLNEACSNPVGVFRGIYTIDTDEHNVTVYSMFTGLDLPHDRIEQLKSEAKEKMAAAAQKNEARMTGLTLKVEEETVSAAAQIKKKIETKKSAFGKLHNAAVIDKRK